METRRLEYFVQIVDSGSINRAAAAIGIAQPALSQQLSVLEHELKARLVDRSPTGITLTEAGRRLYVRAQVILRQVGSLKLELAEEAGAIAGVVAIGLPPSHGASIGSPLLRRAREAYPSLRLQIIEDGATALAAQLHGGLLDFAISPVRIADPGVEGDLLFDEELFLISAPSLRPASTDLASLAALPWIVTASPNAIRGQLSSIFTQADLQPHIVAEVNSLPLVIRAVQQGLGVTLLPKGAVGDALEDGSVGAVGFATPPPRRTVYLYRRRADAMTASGNAVRGLVLEVARELADPARTQGR